MPTKHLQYNLFNLKLDLEKSKGRPVTWLEVAEATDIHVNTLYNLARNRTKRLDLEIVTKLVHYFNQEGLQVQVSDLFQWVESDVASASEQ